MRYRIVHESSSRLRIHMACSRMTMAQADTLEYFLRSLSYVKDSSVYENTQDAVIIFTRTGSTYMELLEELDRFFISGQGNQGAGAREYRPGNEPVL